MQAGLLGVLFDGNRILDSEQCPGITTRHLHWLGGTARVQGRGNQGLPPNFPSDRGGAVPSEGEWELLQAAGRRLWTLQGSV